MAGWVAGWLAGWLRQGSTRAARRIRLWGSVELLLQLFFVALQLGKPCALLLQPTQARSSSGLRCVTAPSRRRPQP